jgi:hypothetical protein
MITKASLLPMNYKHHIPVKIHTSEGLKKIADIRLMPSKDHEFLDYCYAEKIGSPLEAIPPNGHLAFEYELTIVCEDGSYYKLEDFPQLKPSEL